MKKINNKLKILTIFIAFIIVFGGYNVYRYINYNNNAQSEIQSINNLINNNKYLEAYNKCNNFKYKKYGNDNKINKITEELNRIAEENYIKGIKILEKDKSNSYINAKDYFNNYIDNYKYADKRYEESEKIINLIEEYVNKQNELSSKSNIVSYYEDNNKIIKNTESYIESFDYFRNIIDTAMDNTTTMNLYNIYSTWNNNKDYYYSMKGDIGNLYNSLGEHSIFNDEDIEKIYKYIDNGIMPGEYIERYIASRKISSSDKNDFINQYTDYTFLKNKVTNMLTSKKELLTKTTGEVEDINNKLSQIDDEIIKLCNY